MLVGGTEAISTWLPKVWSQRCQAALSWLNSNGEEIQQLQCFSEQQDGPVTALTSVPVLKQAPVLPYLLAFSPTSSFILAQFIWGYFKAPVQPCWQAPEVSDVVRTPGGQTQSLIRAVKPIRLITTWIITV